MSHSSSGLIRRLEKLLFNDTEACFECRYPVTEAVSRLAAEVSPIILPSGSGKCAVGRVSEEEVAIKRHAPMVMNSFKPVFYGTFETQGEKTVLTGCFTVTLLTKMFVFVWLAAMTFFTLLGSIPAIIHAITEYPDGLVALWLPLAGLAMIGLGATMALCCKWFVRKDTAILSELIVRTIGRQAGEK